MTEANDYQWFFDEMYQRRRTLVGGYVDNREGSAGAALEFAHIAVVRSDSVYLWLHYVSSPDPTDQPYVQVLRNYVGSEDDCCRIWANTGFNGDYRWGRGEQTHTKVRFGLYGDFVKASDPWLLFHLGRASSLIEPLELFGTSDQDKVRTRRVRNSIDELAASNIRRLTNVVGRR